MVTLITGATGFLGKYLLPHLKSLSESEIFHVCALNKFDNSHAQSESIDLTDTQKVLSYIQKIRPQRVYHLAGIARVSQDISFESYFSQNTLSTQTLLEALVSLNSPVEFFLTSSVHVYGNQEGLVNERAELKPEGAYGFTKYLAEETLKHFVQKYPQIRGVVGRLYSCVGPNQPLGFVTSDICKKVKELKKSGGTRLEVGPTDSTRRFTDVRDVIKTFPILLKAQLPSRYEVFNIAHSKDTRVGQLIQLVLDLERVPAKIISRSDNSNSFKGLKVDTSKMAQFIPESTFRPLESTLKDILASSPS
jgi:UDP-glucose 4-epimerase